MKRIGAILCMMLIVFTLSAPCASAAGLGITKTSPGDGTKGVPLENMSVKVFFDKDVYNKDNVKVNNDACKLVDSKGREVPTRVILNPKDKDIALILAEKNYKNGKPVTIEPITEYTLYIDDTFVAADGDTLAKPEKISFKTLNPSTTMKISMGMMAVMMIAMVFASSKAMKKQQEEKDKENNTSKKEEKFNPYKVAKETGKSVEEVLAIEKKRKEREAAKEERKEHIKSKYHREREDEDDDVEEYLEPGHYKVKTKRKVADAGSSYITGRKAEAEKKAIIDAKVKAEKAAGTYGKKGKHGKKR